MAVSTATSVKANLLTQLAARPGLSGVGLNWAAPINTALLAASGEEIYFGDTKQTEAYVTIGGTPAPREEHYTLQVFVQVHREGDDPKGTELRCQVLVDELRAQLRTDPTVGGAIAVPARQDGYAHVDGADMSTRPAEPQGWLSRVAVTVMCGARI